MGTPNAGLTTPFTSAVRQGLGFSQLQPNPFAGDIQLDVGDAMHGVNASLWMRIEFEAATLSYYDELTLRMKYDDGFVAYVNGMEVARKNAPDPLDPLPYDATATATRSNTQAVVFEEIDVSDGLGVLRAGTNVLAIHGLNISADDNDFLLRPELIASGTVEGPQYMISPTPRTTNQKGALGRVADTNFSIDRGFYDAPFDVAITTSTPGVTIRYTLDGAPPSESHGTVYTQPIRIDRTTTLRAFAYKPGYVPTNVDTQTYIFVDDVVRQDHSSTIAAGFPSSWGGTSPDYGMDPDVIGTFNPITGQPNGNDHYGGIYAQTIRDDLKSLPTLSIVMDVDDMFGSSGIYANPTQHGAAWERATSVELINPDGSEGFQVDCGIRIQGGYFRRPGACEKHSFRLLFKGQYGPTKLNFPWFGEDAVDSFDTITLRAGANDGYAWSSARYTEQYTRDEFGRSLQRATGQVGSHGTFVHLYINGVYWGLYNPVERPDHSFSASYFGGDKDNWDAINSGSPTNGDNNAWNQMISQTQAASSSLSYYMRLQGNNPDGTPNPAYPNLLDVTNYVDYLIVNIWGGNWDWPWKNWWAARDRTAESTGFKFYNWDYENTIGNNLGRSPLDKNTLNNNFSSAGVPHTNLKNNAEYRMLFADRIHRLFFNDGVLTPESLIPRYTELAAQVERAMVAESARWGDMHHSTPLTLEDWYDRDANYNDGRAGRDWVLEYYLPQRTAIVLGQFKSAGLYPNVSAPTFRVKRGSSVWNQHGGLLQPGDRLTFPTSAGTIYYTTDGTDPRQIGGGISPLARQYSPGALITLADSAVVKSRVYSGGQWSALSEAQFYVHTPASAATLAITEINYNPYDPTAVELSTQPPGDEDFTASSFEFVELLNRSSSTVIDLTNVEFTEGITFRFNDGVVRYLTPGERVVVVADTDAFAARYGGGINIAGTFTGKLDNSGETLRLVAADGQDIVNFRYNDNDPWPSRPDGRGATLELVHQSATAAADYGNSEVWRPSSRYGGTPGKVPAAGLGIVVNEVLTHTDYPQVDAIELHNTTRAAVDLGGWYLSDDWGWASSPDNGDYKKFRIPDGTLIPAGGYLVFHEGHYDHLGVLRFDGDEFGGLDGTGFALNGAEGDEVWLMEADAAGNLTRFADHVEFREAANGESFGRWPNAEGRMYPMAELTLGRENTGPRVGPVVITEIMYSPPDGGDEFVELFNPTFAPVPFFDPQHPENTWRIGGLDYNFPQDVEIPAGGLVLVVPIDPAAFRTKYSVPAEVQVFGPYQGALNNAGERLQLLRPDGPVDDDPTDDIPPVIPRLLVDEVDYEPTGLWPAEADGGGDSLHRGQSGSWGNDPANWTAGVPTPGAVTFTLEPQVVARHVFYNDSTFDGGHLEIGAADDLAIATDKTALRPGEMASFANYTGYSRGINGIMIDLFAPGAAITADDFRFHMGNDDDPILWAKAPPPADFGVRAGAGAGGSDRVTFAWESGAIHNAWLQVTVLSGNLALAADDVFYFGNAVGESGNAPENARVTVVDLLLARNNLRSVLDPATVDFAYDYNRDGRVNSTDVLLARNNQTGFLGALKLIDLSSGGIPQAASSPVPTPAGLDWLIAFEATHRSDRSSDRDDRAAAAVDRLLATYRD